MYADNQKPLKNNFAMSGSFNVSRDDLFFKPDN
jgi:hypothetical protein